MIRALSLARLRSSASLYPITPNLSPPWIRVPSAPHSDDSSAGGDDSSAPRLFVVQPRLRPDSALRAKLDEAICLASSLEEQRDGCFDADVSRKDVPQHAVVQNPAARGRKTRADTFFGPGTVEAVKIQLNHGESKGEVDAVFVNTILSGIQQRNLERAWGKPVLDRVGLIIEIFNAHANTKEGKLQAELAALMYKKTRLVRVRGPDGRYTFGVDGEAEVVSARGRGSGGRGFIGGAGETELHLQQRRISERRRLLLSQIEEVRRTRALQRAARKRHGGSHGQGLATVAVVGYTNAGKSTLVSALSDSPLYSDSRLFATVDPRLRNVILPSGRKVLLSDTVGFISDLPVQLVEAFHATLEEVVEADLLVHVLDSTAPNLDEHRSTVLSVLEQIGVSKEKLENMIEVWNKIDCQDKGLDGDEYFDDGDYMNCDQSPREDSNEAGRSCELSGETGHNAVSNVSAQELVDGHPNDLAYKNSTDDAKAMDKDDQEDDHSDEWLESEDDIDHRRDEDVSPIPWKSSTNDQQRECSKDLRCSQYQSGPDVKTSALMRVGLQELLELIDNRLKDQDEKFKVNNVVERNVFGRKWRPSREEETGVAV